MKNVPLTEVDDSKYVIKLQNGKDANLYQVIITRVYEINPDNDILVYRYQVPCPLCDCENLAYSYDGKLFATIQINCKNCGIFYRPVLKRN